jgi:uncharacterized protein (TIGR02246 family)
MMWKGLAAALLLMAAGFAFPQTANHAAGAAAQAMVDRFVDSWNRADGAAYGENYWPDAELVDPTGAIVSGRAAIVKEHVDLWSGIFHGTRASGQVRKVRMLGPNHMMVDFDVQVRGVHQFPPGSPPNAQGELRNHLKHIMEKRNGAWKVLAAQNTFIAAQESMTPAAGKR